MTFVRCVQCFKMGFVLCLFVSLLSLRRKMYATVLNSLIKIHNIILIILYIGSFNLTSYIRNKRMKEKYMNGLIKSHKIMIRCKRARVKAIEL